MENELYGQVLLDHNMHPFHKHELEGATCFHEGINPSCGDDIVLKLTVRDGVVTDGAFQGSGCAISQASADIMLELVIGRSVEEALHLKDLFSKMIEGTVTDEELEELDEAGALQNVSHMPARVKCAMLGWRTLETLLKEDEK